MPTLAPGSSWQLTTSLHSALNGLPSQVASSWEKVVVHIARNIVPGRRSGLLKVGAIGFGFLIYLTQGIIYIGYECILPLAPEAF